MKHKQTKFLGNRVHEIKNFPKHKGRMHKVNQERHMD